MGRLRPEALISNELIDLHYIRDCGGGDNPEPCDISNYEGVWGRAAKRARTIDPDGRRCYALLRRLQLGRAA
jgi:hypothetical protein